MNYRTPSFLFNKHLETIYPALFRKVELQNYTRERITTPDDDFLDVDWILQSSNELVIISHGLEGRTDRAYIKGMAKAAAANNMDVLAWNYRGCSGEMNRQLRFYHSGATDDLDTIIRHAIATNRYQKIFLIGFSLGGNLTLKYLGEKRERPELIERAVAFSVPMQLESSCETISRKSNWIYSFRFLKSLKGKVLEKSRLMPGIDISRIDKISTLKEFDDYYTAPIHGFKDAHDYYMKNSSLQFINDIQIPTLIVNAKNDPFLSEECYPVQQLDTHHPVTLECPGGGGHVGFAQFNKNGLYWSEVRAMEFLRATRQQHV